MKVIVHGSSGRMGQNVSALCEKNVCGSEAAAYVSRHYETDEAKKQYKTIADFKGNADCVIDFSNHTATKELLEYCIEKNLPVVIATTGQTEEEKGLISRAAEKIPIFLSANMSIGIAVLNDLCKRAAAAFPDADIEIIEKHHNQKLDVPSGTALIIANGIKEVRPNAVFNVGRHENGKRTKEEIGIHSLRYGSEVGTHEIIVSTGTETITLKHEAENRVLFAEGALKAAEFIISQPAGLYDMKDLF